MSFLNCGAGGVLMGVSLIHVLPEAGEALNPAVNDFPLSFYITFAGILLMVTLVKLGGHEHSHEHDHVQQLPTDSEANDVAEVVPNDCATDESLSLVSKEEPEKHNLGSVIMLLIGLMIHDISEGVSLGLCTKFSDALSLFLAIFLHKWCEQVCQAIAGIREGLTFK